MVRVVLVVPLFVVVSFIQTIRNQEVAVNSGSINCINGEIVNGACVCFTGWMGANCSSCGGRIRLTESSGTIADDVNVNSSSNYASNSACVFFIMTDRPAAVINLRVHLLHLECLWDYLQVFDGDSVYANKIATYTGNLVEEVSPGGGMGVLMNSTNDTAGVNVTRNGTDMMAAENMRGVELQPMHTLTSSGPSLLLYFYSDSNSEGPGFNISYWLDYECPDECSGRGVCNSTRGECLCPPDWTGSACERPVCLNNCSNNGVCDAASGKCICREGYQGMDCSIDTSRAHWSPVSFSSSLTVSMDQLPRAGHSAVSMDSYMLVYGGYRFTSGYYSSDAASDVTRPGFTSSWTDDDLLRYDFRTRRWEALNTSSVSFLEDEEGEEEEVEEGDEFPEVQFHGTAGDGGGEQWNASLNGNNSTEDATSQYAFPSPRYGHTAVLYNMSMYVFGGSLYPSEDFTSDLWELNLETWEWQYLFNSTHPISQSAPPIPVRDHTAHVVGTKMVVLYGLTATMEGYVPVVQEYDFISETWSVPALLGASAGLQGRAAHSSVYNEEEGLIYIYGGRCVGGLLDQLISYHPDSHIFSLLAPSGSSRYLHTLSLVGPSLLSFGGCRNTEDCFSSDVELYNIQCNTWETLEVPGLMSNDSRLKHTATRDPEDQSLLVFGGYVGTLRGDMLRLVSGNCSQWGSIDECAESGGPLCVWEGEEEQAGRCVPINVATITDSYFSCPNNSCSPNFTCSVCLSSEHCQYSTCLNESESSSSCPNSTSPVQCRAITDCYSCQLLGCSWETTLRSRGCYQPTGSPSGRTVVSDCSMDLCHKRDSCDQCLQAPTQCFWCPSLSSCLPRSNHLYPSTFTFGQCLGWVEDRGSCARDMCEDHSNCSSCQSLLHCGWCNDPSDTGRGACVPGGFRAPVGNVSVCQATTAGMLGGSNETSEEVGEWQFDVCSACQCNGHSRCLNGSSVCVECADNTTGSSCELCALGSFGNPRNGAFCQECDCNGYNDVCDIDSGVCDCRTQGVGGDHCTNCTGDYQFGDTNNFCYAQLRAGFIYTYQVTEAFVDRGYYAITPVMNIDLDFRFELVESEVPVQIQLYLGRVSEKLWVLVRITDPVMVEVGKDFRRTYGDFSYSNKTESKTRLESFTHPAIRNTENFTHLLDSVTGNDYTRHVWDRDVTLVLLVTQLSNSTKFRVTVEQQNYIFLLYFFATFITCFSLLLTIFLIAWYIKRKLAYRSFIRQQYIELQRRVARPFAKVMLLLDRQTAAQVREQQKEPYPSYVAVETCKDEKAAILSMFVRLPGEEKTGLPSLGRTGLCLGSTVVHVSNKKPKMGGVRQRKKEQPGRGHERRGDTGDRGRLLSSEETVVHNGRRSNQAVTSSASSAAIAEPV